MCEQRFVANERGVFQTAETTIKCENIFRLFTVGISIFAELCKHQLIQSTFRETIFKIQLLRISTIVEYQGQNQCCHGNVRYKRDILHIKIGLFAAVAYYAGFTLLGYTLLVPLSFQ